MKYGCYGVVDKTGNVVVPFIYDYIYHFYYGIAMVYDNKEKKCGYIDKSGNIIIPIIYDSCSDFKDGLVYAEKDSEYFYINKDGIRVDK